MRVEQKPKYEVSLFSDPKTKVKYRPFVLEEERNLLMALEEKDVSQIISTITDTISACTFGTVDAKKIPYFDVEYLFVKIRSKSVGELIDIIGTCDCKENGEAKTEFQIDLDKLTIVGELKDTEIKIPDSDYSVIVRYPSSEDVIRSQNIPGVEFVASLFVKVWNSEEVFENPSVKECVEFIDSLNNDQFKPIDDFFDTMPVLTLSHTWHCKHCGKEHTSKLTGMEDFFQ